MLHTTFSNTIAPHINTNQISRESKTNVHILTRTAKKDEKRSKSGPNIATNTRKIVFVPLKIKSDLLTLAHAFDGIESSCRPPTARDAHLFAIDYRPLEIILVIRHITVSTYWWQFK